MAYKSPMDGLPDEHMRLVGIISAHWEYVELLLERAIAEVMGRKYSDIALLTGNIGFYQKCDLILVYARVFEEPEPETWKRFTGAIKELKDAYPDRNQYVHAKWKRDITTRAWGKSSIRTKGGKLTISDVSVQCEDLEKAAARIWNAAEAFLALCQEHGVLTGP